MAIINSIDKSQLVSPATNGIYLNVEKQDLSENNLTPQRDVFLPTTIGHGSDNLTRAKDIWQSGMFDDTQDEITVFKLPETVNLSQGHSSQVDQTMQVASVLQYDQVTPPKIIYSESERPQQLR